MLTTCQQTDGNLQLATCNKIDLALLGLLAAEGAGDEGGEDSD